MVTSGVSYNGKTDLFFINPHQIKVNTQVLVEHLHEQYLSVRICATTKT
jgi:hypothetical protein